MIKKFTAAVLALSLLASASAAKAAEYAARGPEEARASMLSVYKSVQALPEANKVVRAYFNRAQNTYEFAYLTKDGSRKTLSFDAVSGSQIN